MNDVKFKDASDWNNLVDYFKGDTLAAQVWLDKYALKDEEGFPIEYTPKDMHLRMANEFAKAEANLPGIGLFDKKKLSPHGQKRFSLQRDSEYFLAFLEDFNMIVPGGSVMANLGNPKFGSTSNCFFVALEDDSMESIFKVGAQLASIFKYRGGCGINISPLRPANSKVNNSAKTSSGAVSFMPLFSEISKVVGQEGRRAAMMISINVQHPDVLEFILSKRELEKITGANISVQLTDEFMYCVRKQRDFYLRWSPKDKADCNLAKLDLSDVELDSRNLQYNQLVYLPEKDVYVKRVKAVYIYKQLIESAYLTAEPGILYWSKTLSYSLSSFYTRYRELGTNPCVTPDTTILTKKGFCPIKSLVGEKIEIWNGYEWSEVTPFKTSNAEQVFLVTFSNGSSLECTSYHEFILKDGTRKQLKDCKVGEELVSFILPNVNDFIKGITISSIIKTKISDTYCLTDDKNHSCLFNSIVTGQCGEIPLADKDACRLFAINLGKIDLNKLYEIAYEQVVMADLLIDLEDERIDKILHKIGNRNSIEFQLWRDIQLMAKEGRRLGCGITGLFEAVAHKLIAVFPKVSTTNIYHFIENIFKTKMRAELDATIDLSVIRGPFVGYSKHEQSDLVTFIADMFPEQYTRMCKYGRRNVSFSTIAPTGTISVLTGTTSGIEPLFAPFYTRRRKVDNATENVDSIDVDGAKFTNHAVVHRGLIEWAEKHCHVGTDKDTKSISWEEIFKLSPYYGYTSAEIDITQRLTIQSIAQQYTTHSISSTLNLPKETSVEDINNIFTRAHRFGLKGVTIYRDGSRNGILVTDSSKETTNVFQSHDAPKRPKTLVAESFVIKVSGIAYAVIVGLLENKPYEIFAAICPQGFKSQVGSVTKVKRGIYSWTGINGDVVENLNTLSEFSTERAATLYISMLLRTGAKLPFVVDVAKKADGNIVSFTSAICRVLSKYIQKEETGEICPKCGEKLIRDAGCVRCTSCSHSLCMIAYETKNKIQTKKS